MDGDREFVDAEDAADGASQDLRERMIVTDVKMMLQAFKGEVLQSFEERDSRIDNAILENKKALNELKTFVKDN